MVHLPAAANLRDSRRPGLRELPPGGDPRDRGTLGAALSVPRSMGIAGGDVGAKPASATRHYRRPDAIHQAGRGRCDKGPVYGRQAGCTPYWRIGEPK